MEGTQSRGSVKETIMYWNEWMNITQSCPPLWFHGLWPTRLLCLWNSPGKNTGVGCHSLPQGDLPNPGIEPVSPALQVDPLLSESPGKYFITERSQLKPKERIIVHHQGWFPVTLRGGAGVLLGRLILSLLISKSHFLSPPEVGMCSCLASHNVLGSYTYDALQEMSLPFPPDWPQIYAHRAAPL